MKISYQKSNEKPSWIRWVLVPIASLGTLTVIFFEIQRAYSNNPLDNVVALNIAFLSPALALAFILIFYIIKTKKHFIKNNSESMSIVFQTKGIIPLNTKENAQNKITFRGIFLALLFFLFTMSCALYTIYAFTVRRYVFGGISLFIFSVILLDLKIKSNSHIKSCR